MPPSHPLPEILWCKSTRKNRNLGWRFPIEVEALLKDFTGARSTLHLFGGRASWGTRIDIDPIVEPDVIADAWLPPFGPGSFDVVIMDPPYVSLSGQIRSSLFWTARYLARQHVVWWSTTWVHPCCDLRLERSWLANVGRSSLVRTLEIFRVCSPQKIIAPRRHFARGPAIRFNRWLRQPHGLPFPEQESMARGRKE